MYEYLHLGLSIAIQSKLGCLGLGECVERICEAPVLAVGLLLLRSFETLSARLLVSTPSLYLAVS